MIKPFSSVSHGVFALVVALGIACGLYQPWASSHLASASAAPFKTFGDEIVTTQNEIKSGLKTLKYTAHAGLLPIRHNDTGEIRGHIFFIAYLLDRPPKSPARPLTFLWNGGPGANSTLVHLSAFGPKRILPGDTPDAEWKVDDNEMTWLEHSDLVFVDPVGTGFSRPAKAEYGADFYSTLGDIASVAEFVRVYLTRFDAWDAPLLIGGESYGVWRAAGVAETLLQRGRKVAGVILISGGIPVGPVVSEEMKTALFVPARTAAAFHHKKLPADLQTDRASTLAKVEKWARTEYAPALAKLDKLTEKERETILSDLARFTGLDVARIDKKTLIVSRQQLAEQLLLDKKLVLARYDTRLTTKEDSSPRAGRNIAINKYLRSTLKFKTDLAYMGNEQGFSPATGGKTASLSARWNYNQGPPQPKGTQPNSDSPPGGHQPWLRRAIALEPSMKAFVATGLYDSLNSCAFHDHLVSQLEPALKLNITTKCYEGGHMMYESPGVREQMHQDFGKFVQSTCAGSS